MQTTLPTTYLAHRGVPDPTGPLRGTRTRFLWNDPGVNRADHEEIAGLLHGLLIRLDDRLPGKDMTLIAEFIDAGELGLALGQLADVLSEDEQPLAQMSGPTCWLS
jgi:hypothetical protein